MVFQGESSRSSISLTQRNWFSCRKFRHSTKNTAKRMAAHRSYGKSDCPMLKTSNNTDASMEENEALKKKIKRIEQQNHAQLRRLQQLEKLVIQLSHSMLSQVVPSPSTERRSPGASSVRQRIVRVSSQAECEEQNSDFQTEGGDGLTRDLASLMEEFDRNGREKGMVYGVTPSHSFADSDDLSVTEVTEKMPSSTEDVHKAAPPVDMCSTPMPMFITPNYRDCSKYNKETNSVDTEEPHSSPQSCFITPILLTSDAIKEVEQGFSDENIVSRFDPKRYCAGASLQSGTNTAEDDPKIKTTPFTNLLAWISQTCPDTKHCRTLEKGHWPAGGHPSSLGMRGPPGCSSPGSHSVGTSASEQVHKWSQSLRLPLLSPMPESLESEQEANASDEEELVVDEAVSHSVAVGRRRQQRRQRQRNESVCSAVGPCVAPDLVMAPDSGGTYLSQVREEDIMTEIAGELEGSMLIEDLPTSLQPLKEGPEEQEKLNEKEEKLIKGGKSRRDLAEILEKKVKLETSPTAIFIKEEAVTVEESLTGNEADKELISTEEESNSVKISGESSNLAVDGKDTKLPAGSFVLAMVDETGSLVPLPQFQVDPQSLSGTLDHTAEEDVDVETVSDGSPVLEAGDLASLLAQFEASEAVNTSGSDNPEPEGVLAEGIKKQDHGTVTTDSHQTPATGTSQHKKTSQASPTHQNIKDSLPKEIIEKIKASTKRKSTQMLSEPVALRKGRGSKSKESTNGHKSKGNRGTTQQLQSQPDTQEDTKDQRVPPPLDHDYCCSGDKTKRNGKLCSNHHFNKLPDYYTVVSTKDANNMKTSTNSLDDGQDDVGKKDSGVESGDVSDASVETEERKKEEISRLQQNSTSSPNEKKPENADKDDIYNKLPAYMTDIGNARPKDNGDEETNIEVMAEVEVESVTEKQEETKKHKRKLNLSEYRQRIKSAQSSRCPSPAYSTTSTVASSPKHGVEGPPIPNQVKVEEQDVLNTTKEPLPQTTLKEEMEEGELEGDSEPEVLTRVNPSATETESSCRTPVPLEVIARGGENTLGSLVFYRNSAAKPDTHWKVGSHQGLSSRRWSSSSRSRSRSRSRSHSRRPVLNKKRHSHRHRCSSHKRRRGYRESQSSHSPRPWRRWSRSHSRSRSRGSSSSHSRRYSSSRSRSRSRSRSSSKTRDRWGYRRWSSGRKRRSPSGSRSGSSSHYRASRSRSPIWRGTGRSRSPSHSLSGRSRRGEDENRVKQVEERRVIYIGRISEGTTKAELRARFEKYGTIVDISVHFRERGDNYGFVTYKNRDEAYFAVEHGNDDPALPRYDLCFGGRRAFCKVSYSDLDAQPEDSNYQGRGSGPRAAAEPLDFDSLLRAAMKRNVR